jgi:hypothetical protein
LSSSCKKENSIDIWEGCKNPVSKDVSFRKGVWFQSPIRKPSTVKIEFINDSFLAMYDDEGNIAMDNRGNPVAKIYYKFDSCNAFKFIKFWLVQKPNAIEYEIYKTSYNEATKEWYLIAPMNVPYGSVGGWDTFKFKKE